MSTTVQQDAQEFGIHLRAGGWRLGLLVARNVRPGAGQGRRSTSAGTPQKLSIIDFGKQAGVGRERVAAYFDAWEKAAEAEIVPHAADLKLGVEIVLPDDQAQPWNDFYTAGRSSTDDSVRRSVKAVERNIASDPKFAEAAAKALAEHRPATIARQAAKPDVARAIARNDPAREAVEDHAIEHRARLQGERPDPVEAGEKARKAMGRALGDETDQATDYLLGAASDIAHAIMCKERWGIDHPEAESAALNKIDRYLAAYRSDSTATLTDDDRQWADSIGVDL